MSSLRLPVVFVFKSKLSSIAAAFFRGLYAGCNKVRGHVSCVKSVSVCFAVHKVKHVLTKYCSICLKKNKLPVIWKGWHQVSFLILNFILRNDQTNCAFAYIMIFHRPSNWRWHVTIATVKKLCCAVIAAGLRDGPQIFTSALDFVAPPPFHIILCMPNCVETCI